MLGIAVTPKGDIWYASLAGNHIAKLDPTTGQATVVEPPTSKQGARRIWSDSNSRLWVSEWNSGNVSMHDPADGSWKAWKLPGTSPHAYAVYVDDRDKIWLTDFSANAIVRFDPASEKFNVFASDKAGANVRQLAWAGRRGMGRRIRQRTSGGRSDRRAHLKSSRLFDVHRLALTVDGPILLRQ